MKKLIAFLVCALCAFMLFACNKPADNGGDNGENHNNNSQTNEDLDKELDAKYKGFATGKKLYLTTIGQGEIEVIESFFDDLEMVAGEDYVKNNNLTAADVEDGGVVFVVVGTSGKGLGAAKTDLNGEKARANDFIAKEGITLVVFHVGGEGRRGAQSDPIIEIVCPKAAVLLVVNTGNADGLFTTIAKDNNIDLYLFSKTIKLDSAIKTLLNK